MEHYAGLDVSVKETSVCVVDGAGQVVREAKVTSEPRAILGVLVDEGFTLKRIGLEAGPLSQGACRSGLAGDLCRDGAHEGGAVGSDQQERLQ